MDFSDISLMTAVESETAAAQRSDAVETAAESGKKPEEAPFSEDTLIDFNNIETLDMSEIESLLEKQEGGDTVLNADTVNFPRIDAVTFPAPTPASDIDQQLEMEDQYLTFDELQLDTDGSKSDALVEVKESFQIPASGLSAPASPPEAQEKPAGRQAVSEDREKFIATEAGVEEELEDIPPAPKKGLSPAILVAVILAVIAAVAYGGYLILNSMGIPIPFIGQQAPANVSDAGNLSIKSFDISSKFVDNNKIGKLFVITGKVKNEYSMPRGFIQISGKIYTKDKTLAKTETVYCGNILTDADLAVADVAKIQQRLQNRSGDNRINEKVQPGASIPFMIVFSGLPTNLEEFTTEILSSVAS
jgi:hypothetical protein